MAFAVAAALCNGFACRPVGALCSPFSVAVEGLARCACTLCSPGRVSAPCAQALAPFRVFVERGVLRGGEAAPPISESANQPISRALRWSARVSGAEKPPLQSANQPISQSAGRSDGAPVSSWKRGPLCLRPYATASSCNLTCCLAGGCAILWT